MTCNCINKGDGFLCSGGWVMGCWVQSSALTSRDEENDDEIKSRQLFFYFLIYHPFIETNSKRRTKKAIFIFSLSSVHVHLFLIKEPTKIACQKKIGFFA